VLRRLNVEGPVAEAVMGHGRRMRSHSTVLDPEVAQLGPRIAAAIGLTSEEVGVSVGDQRAEMANVQPAMMPTGRSHYVN
jgi:hypothetical protein